MLIGHGSVRYPNAGDAMRRHANRLRQVGHFAQVEIALLNGDPTVQDALARIIAPSLRVVPFFMEDGYFARVAVPHALQDRPARMCLPVGVHDGMAGLIQRQALAACDDLGIPSQATAVLIVGHGSSKAPGRALALHRHTTRVAATKIFARVEAACLEETPFVADALHGLRTYPLVVIGFFANHGGHVRDDLPALIAADQAARAQIELNDARQVVSFQGPVTDDPMMVQIILDQATQGPIRG